MDRSWHQNKGGDYAAMEECYYHVELDQATSLSSEVDDGALLMELLEDMPPSDMADGDVDRLTRVIQSLEAEIDGGAAVMVDDGSMVTSEEDAMILEEMLLDLGGCESVSFGYWPPEAPVVAQADEGWYLYADECEGSMIGYMDEQYHYVESCTEQVYSPLWE